MIENLEKKYFSNIGKRIKKIALTSFLIECVCAIIAGVIMLFIAITEEGGFFALLIIPLAIIVSFSILWLLNAPIYAAGELVDKMSYTAKKVKSIDEKTSSEDSNKNEKRFAYQTTQKPACETKVFKGWTCKKCGTKNTSGICCKDCGEYK